MQTYIVCSCLLLTLSALARAKDLVISPVVDNSLQSASQSDILAEQTSQTLDFRFNYCADNRTGSRNVSLRLLDGSERNLNFPRTVCNVPCLYNDTLGFGVNATIDALMIGFVTLQISDEETQQIYADYSVGVTRPPPTLFDQVYIYGLMVLVSVSIFYFGIDLDLQKVKAYAKKPVAPAIGVLCQFILMPLLGFSIAMAMTGAHNSEKLGIFAASVAPGGGLSNVWIFVLNGDLDLSITMTFVSTIAAIGFLPLWMYTLGTYIIGDSSIVIPFTDILQALALLIIPVSIGIVVKRFLPRVAKKVKFLQKPIVLVLILFGAGVGIYSNQYAFELIFTDARLAVCTFLLPYVGGLFGFIIALACQQGKKLSMTIGIETGIQNGNIAVVLLRNSLPQPWADISSAIPLVMGLFTFFPFPFVVVGKRIYLKCIKKEEEGDKSEGSTITKQNSLELVEAGVDNPAVDIEEQQVENGKDPEEFKEKVKEVDEKEETDDTEDMQDEKM